MAIENIYARSPFIIQVDEPSQQGSKLFIWIWSGTGSAPTNPTHITSKKSPSATNTANEYNISPYIREYLQHTYVQNVYDTISTTPTEQWCNVKVRRYRWNGTSYYMVDEKQYIAFDGYGYYENGANPDNGDVMLAQGTYNYWYDSTNDPSSNQYQTAGHVTSKNASGYSVQWVNLKTSAFETSPTGTTKLVDIPRVFPSWYEDGNTLMIFDDIGNLIWKAKFAPIQECRYTPLTLDFVNKYGAWQREFMFKASYEEFEVQTQAYNIMQSSAVHYSTMEGQFSDFNINGREDIRVNTGFVKEDFNDTIRQIYLSERILLNGRPVQLKKKRESKIKDINARLRNFTLEFTYANELINSIV